MRKHLSDKTGIATLPLLFVKGELIGTYEQSAKSWEEGHLPLKLDRAGVERP